MKIKLFGTAIIFVALVLLDPANDPNKPALPREIRDNNRFHHVVGQIDGVMSIITPTPEERYYKIELDAFYFNFLDKPESLTKKGKQIEEQIFRAAKLSGIGTPLRFSPHYPQVPIPDP